MSSDLQIFLCRLAKVPDMSLWGEQAVDVQTPSSVCQTQFSLHVTP